MTTSLLQVKDLNKTFGALRVTREVTFDVPEGSILGVIGPNGAGKTTLFNLVTGFLAADSGSILFDGREIVGRPPHKIAALGLRRTFQSARPLATYDVLSNVVAGTYLQGKNGLIHSVFSTGRSREEERDNYRQAAQLLKRLGLDEVSDRVPAELASGQLRLLEVARALAGAPRLLLLDEPAAGLNGAETEGLEAILRSVRDEGVTVVIVEHDVELVLRISDRVLVLNDGAVLVEGVPSDIRTDTRVAEAYFGVKGSKS